MKLVVCEVCELLCVFKNGIMARATNDVEYVRSSLLETLCEVIVLGLSIKRLFFTSGVGHEPIQHHTRTQHYSLLYSDTYIQLLRSTDIPPTTTYMGV